MHRIYTIGFTKKSAQDFFTLLKKNDVRMLLDIRLNNSSQLAAFAKGSDLKYFIQVICGADYIHDTMLAPTEDILKGYKEKRINWEEYERLFNNLLEQRNIKQHLDRKYPGSFDDVCLLCTEDKPAQCHRRLVAEYIQRLYPEKDIKIFHL